MKKKRCCLGYIGDELPSYIGIIISQYKDPYYPTGIMESKRFFFVAHLIFVGDGVMGWVGVDGCECLGFFLG